MTIKLEATDLYKVYGERPDEVLELARQGCHPSNILSRTGQMLAVSDVSFRVREGEIFTIMGLSGSGKSTLVRCLNRLIEPTSGSILIDGESMCEKSRQDLRQVRRTKIAMVFQHFALLPHKSVLENVEFGLKLRGESSAERRDKAIRVLEQVGLLEWKDRRPDNLSGGMRQRVGLARALANDPDILLMDEPFSALDPLIRADLQSELLKIQREIRKTIIFITHDFHEAVKLSDHVAVMRDGAFVQVGTPEEIVLHPIDDYVEHFTREIDRARVVAAREMAKSGSVPVAADMPADKALTQLTASGKWCEVIVGPERQPLAYLFRSDLERSGELAGKTALDFRRPEEVLSVPSSSNLADSYYHFEKQLPLAILDSSGGVMGTMDANDILTQLSESQRGSVRADAVHPPGADPQSDRDDREPAAGGCTANKVTES